MTLNGQEVAVKGPKGELKLTLVDDVTVEQGDAGLRSRRATSRSAPARCGACRGRS